MSSTGSSSGAPPWRRPFVVTAAGVIVVVAAVVAIGRSTSTHRPAPTGAGPPSPTAPPPSPAPTPSQAPAGVGPTTLVAGVPMGYAHSPAGAGAAAVGFLHLDQALVAMSDEAAAAAKRTIAADATAEALVANVAAKLARLHKGYSGGPTTYRIGVLATRVSPVGADRVRVELWHVGVISPPTASPYEEWNTQRYDLVWERGDWRDAGEASTPGPVPQRLDASTPSAQGQLEGALVGFTSAGVVP